MKYNDMDAIERLARTELKDAVQSPPEGVWDDIESRLATSVSANPSQGLKRRGWIAASAASAVLVVAAAIVCFAVFRTKPQTGIVAQQTTPMAPVMLADTSAAADMQVAEEKMAKQVGSVNQPSVANSVDIIAEKETIAAVMRDHSVPASPKTSVADAAIVPVEQAPEVVAESVPVAETTPKTEPKTTAKEESMPVAPTDTDTAKRQPEKLSIVIPNLLTPNGDGYNDCWVIPGLEQYGTVQVQIYTAKSKRIFSSSDYNNDFCGDSYVDGNYFYVILFRDLNISRRGVLVIKR